MARKKIEGPKSFVIDRATWLNGRTMGKEASRLFRTFDSRKCCLGFYLEACGYTERQLNNRPSPLTVDTEEKGQKRKRLVPDWLIGMDVFDERPDDSPAAKVLMTINDRLPSSGISDEDREKRVAALFKENGVKVTFKGKYPKPKGRSSDGF
jgi:hypothetical protein